MPRRADISSVLVIGSGPIVIGQASEFDYSGTQACRVLRAEGIRVILVNSNPATIMTDPEFADATYIEPITVDVVTSIIERERPDALLPTLGGQTALNTAIALHEAGVLDRFGVELIGADIDAIEAAEDRERFKAVVARTGADSARSRICGDLDAAMAAVEEFGLPVVVRPSFTMGGLGSGIAFTHDDLLRIAAAGLAASPTTEVLVEEGLLGWKEYELELMRDHHDNVVVVCTIENLDPMGVHTGDSITVAPALTLTDREFQRLRDIGIAVIREVGVDTGGCNIQFAVNPVDGRVVVIELNPRVSRSSALASKATGFPIAKIAAKLAIGYSLDEIANDITGSTPASFEPAIDYVVVKVPRFAFEKFPQAEQTLTTTMKSVGEAMAIGRNFTEAFQKALRSLERPAGSFHWSGEPARGGALEALLASTAVPTEDRHVAVQQALRAGVSVDDLAATSGIDPWFIDQIALLNEVATEVTRRGLDPDVVRRAKRHGFSDAQLSQLTTTSEDDVRHLRHREGIRPVFKTVDTCAAEFAALTPYHYSSYDEEDEVTVTGRRKIIILGSGPNRIGQGIEFDYSCVHAAFALRDVGYETVMVNCNPETVSTDYDTADRLYFEPLTVEDVLEVVAAENRSGEVVGVVVQLGGQTPLGLAAPLAAAGVPILGTPPAAIALAEDRAEFGRILAEADLSAPMWATATSLDDVAAVAGRLGYPVLVRPSFVLGGRGMEILDDDDAVEAYRVRALAGGVVIDARRPLLVDRFLDDAIEIDVDALCDGDEVYIGGVMEHIEEAGVHSGDSACTLPPITLGQRIIDQVREATEAIARGVGVHGLLNIQFALAGAALFVLEANPRASRTVPFVSKATAVPLAKAAARIMAGATIAELRRDGVLPLDGDGASHPPDAVSVKEAVLPFKRFRNAAGQVVDSVLGPEMRSTGEVMGIDVDFPRAFAKSQAAAFGGLPRRGRVFVSVADRDKRAMLGPVSRLASLGFDILATDGTAQTLRRHGVPVGPARKHSAGVGDDGTPTIVTRILRGEIAMIVNTPSGRAARADGYEIRSAAVQVDAPIITTVAQLAAAVAGIEAMGSGGYAVRSLQEHSRAVTEARTAAGAR